MIDDSGYTYIHESLFMDSLGCLGVIDCSPDEYQQVKTELLGLKTRKVYNLVDVTSGLMRNCPAVIEDLINDVGINIILSTGYTFNRVSSLVDNEMTIEQIANKMVEDVVYGIDGSFLKAGLISGIGSRNHILTETERKLFQSAAMAHAETGVPIFTYASCGSVAREQVKILHSHGVELERVVICHCNQKDNLDEILWLLDQGCHIQFDAIDKNDHGPNKKTIDMITALSHRGMLERVMSSMNITKRSERKVNGGLGYCYLIDEFAPLLLEAGLSGDDVEAILKRNPADFFGPV